jgi:hypothetical protein
MLAELVRYNQLDVSLSSQRYRTEMAQLEDDDKARAKVDFTLADSTGRTWSLKGLRCDVVLVNVWKFPGDACSDETPDLQELHKRFGHRGLVILSVVNSIGTVKPFGCHMLADPGNKVRLQLSVQGSHRSFVYDREGKLVAHAVSRLAISGWLDMLARAGLK